MSRTTWAASAAFAMALLASYSVEAQDEAPTAATVERVEIVNNQYLPTETLLYYVSTKAGDRFEESRLKDDFRRLWDTGFLDDLVLEADDGRQGKIVRFRVVERKRIQIVDFRGSKELSTSQIDDELKKREATIRLDTFYDMTKARKVEAILREMLQVKGRPFATVKHENRNVGGSGTQVSFTITDGPRAKLKEVSLRRELGVQ